MEHLFIDDLKRIASKIEGNNFDYSVALECFKGDIEEVILASNQKKIIVRNSSRVVNSVILIAQGGKLQV